MNLIAGIAIRLSVVTMTKNVLNADGRIVRIVKGVDVIIPPGNIEQFRWAVKIMKDNLILTERELKDLTKIANSTVPLFPLKSR